MKQKTAVKACFLIVFFLAAHYACPGIGHTAEVKIGYVDLRTALNDTDAGKKAKTELESAIKTKQIALDEKGKHIEKLKSDLEKQASVLSADARKSKEDEIERLMRDFQRLIQDSQSEMKKRESELTSKILNELRDIIRKIGKDENYTMIMENIEGIVLYSKKELDITDRVIQKHNELTSKAKK